MLVVVVVVVVEFAACTSPFPPPPPPPPPAEAAAAAAAAGIAAMAPPAGTNGRARVGVRAVCLAPVCSEAAEVATAVALLADDVSCCDCCCGTLVGPRVPRERTPSIMAQTSLTSILACLTMAEEGAWNWAQLK